jgi:undecaprenyl diphosphate synthase
MAKKSDIDLSQMKIPNHVAIILDGNGRWAKKRLMPRNYGHMQGAKTVEKICEDAWNMGIHYLTVYAFSTENWKRPEDEVNALMKLLKNYLKDCIERSNSNDMRVRVIGDKTGLNDEIREKIAELEEMTKNNTGLNFTIAINYGSRDEMVRAMKKMAMDIKDGKVPEDDISEEMFGNYLDTVGIPDPDLLIRTSGEQRLSNYLLWQLAYTEFYFTDVLWPDFSKKDLEDAVFAYNKRDRRFGKIDT